METFLEVLKVCNLSMFAIIAFLQSRKINSIEAHFRIVLSRLNEFDREFLFIRKNNEKLEERTHILFEKIKDENDRSLLAIKGLFEAAKPMKSNNWDGVREAFKRPVRIDTNDRD